MRPNNLFYDPTGTDPHYDCSCQLCEAARTRELNVIFRSRATSFLFCLGLALIFVGVTLLATSEFKP